MRGAVKNVAEGLTRRYVGNAAATSWLSLDRQGL